MFDAITHAIIRFQTKIICPAMERTTFGSPLGMPNAASSVPHSADTASCIHSHLHDYVHVEAHDYTYANRLTISRRHTHRRSAPLVYEHCHKHSNQHCQHRAHGHCNCCQRRPRLCCLRLERSRMATTVNKLAVLYTCLRTCRCRYLCACLYTCRNTHVYRHVHAHIHACLYLHLLACLV